MVVHLGGNDTPSCSRTSPPSWSSLLHRHPASGWDDCAVGGRASSSMPGKRPAPSTSPGLRSVLPAVLPSLPSRPHATDHACATPARSHDRATPRRRPGPILQRPAGGDRSRTRRRHRRRTAPPAGRHRADRQREHGLRRRPGSARVGADQQIRRGLSRPPLLRRLRLRGRGGAIGDRPRQGVVPLRVRQRAAAFRRPGQPGGVARPAAAGRYHPGHEPRRGRPSDAWRGAEPVGKMVPRDPIRRAPRRRPAGLRRTGTPGAGGKAETDHRRRLRVSALHRFPPDPRGWPTRSAPIFMVDMAHFAGLVAADLFPSRCRTRMW